MLDYYRPLLRARYDDWPRRAQDLEALAQIASRAIEDPEDLEEEHRLFYFAVTRARKRLDLSYQQETQRAVGHVVVRLTPMSDPSCRVQVGQGR